jgi:hypothetical protein
MMMNRNLGCVCYVIMYLCGHEWYYSTVNVFLKCVKAVQFLISISLATNSSI